jgi:molecular chaperone DnaK (HSP70)
LAIGKGFAKNDFTYRKARLKLLPTKKEVRLPYFHNFLPFRRMLLRKAKAHYILDRQIPSILSYIGGEQYHGTQAKAQLIRNPSNTVAYFRDYLGKE